jgi:CheY-like chemotaxis protein
MDGREATRVIRAHEDQWDQKADGDPPPSTYIIALSGNARPGLMQDAFDTGLDDYLTKPCTKDELARMLRKWEVHRAKRTTNTSSNTVVPSS